MKRPVLVLGVLALGACAPALAQQDTSRASTSAAYSASGEEGWLGMGISCSHCTFSGPGYAYARQGQAYVTSGQRRWSFREPPVVFSVEDGGPADKAGLRTGDTLVSIEGYPLTSVQGGRRFANVDPGQTVTLRYRRDGSESDAQLTAGSRPRSAELAMQDSLRAMARAQARQQELIQRNLERARAAQQRAMERSQEALERQREYMQQALQQLQQIEGQFPDSTRQESVRRTQRMLDSAVARWRVAESLYAQIPVPAAVAPTTPMAALAPTAPMVSVTPMPPMAALAPVAPLSYREHRAFGPLRYSRQIGDMVIEVRSPYAPATEESDSEVVVTSRDLSVRIAVRARQPAAAPSPRARTPKPAPAPRPARPPED